MARRYYSSIATATTLSSGVDGSATSLLVAGTTGFPGSYPFTIVLEEGVSGKEELCEVTAAGTGGATWTVVRGVDGSSATSHSSGASVRHAVSARDFDEPNAHIDAATNVHGVGVSNAVVGTGSTQTLTNKTISGASNTVSPSSGTVSTATIQDSAVTTAKILDGNVTTAKIADLNVTEGKIAANAVTSGKINAGAVTSGKIAASAVGTTAISDGAVTQAKLSGNLQTVSFNKSSNVDVGSAGGWSAGYADVNTGLASVTGFVGMLAGTAPRILTLVALNQRGGGASASGYVRLYLQNNNATAISSDTVTIHWIAW